MNDLMKKTTTTTAAQYDVLDKATAPAGDRPFERLAPRALPEPNHNPLAGVLEVEIAVGSRPRAASVGLP